MSEASRSWPDYNQVIDDNLQAREDERIQEAKARHESNEPEEGADSDEDRVARARKLHDEHAAAGDEEPIPVAEQKAAGVPPEETVTIAEQKAGTPPPDLAGPAE